MSYTYRSLLKEGEGRLAAAGIREAKNDAWILLASSAGLDRTSYLIRENECVCEAVSEEYFCRIGRRTKREPVQYIEKTAPFMGYDFTVNKNVLIPRMDTEILAEETIKAVKKMLCGKATGTVKNVLRGRTDTDVSVLDMCTGSGCIIESVYLKLKEEGLYIRAAASDISAATLDVARENAARLGAKINFFCGNLFETIEGEYDIIISNPPYICTDIIAELEPEVKEYEPVLALDGKDDGLYFYREIVKDAGRYLKPEGSLIFEIGCEQGEDVARICRAAGYNNIRIIKDYAGLDRVVAADRKSCDA